MSQTFKMLHSPILALIYRQRIIVAVLLVSASLLLCHGKAFAAITASVLDQGATGTDTTSYLTNSFRPDPNTLILAWITTNKDAALLDPVLTGNNLTWIRVNGIDWGGDNNRTTLWKAMGAAPTPGQLSISFGGGKQRGCSWSIIQFSRVATWLKGDGSLAAVVQSATATGSGSQGDVFTIPLAALSEPAANASAGGFAFDTTADPYPAARDGYTSAGVVQHGAPTMTILTEWKIPGSGTISVTQGAVSNFAGIAVEIGACSTTILGNGSDSGGASLIPGGPATFIDSFTFQTLRGTNLVSDVTVTLPAGASGGIASIEITDDTGSTVYGTVNNPATDTPKIPLTTNITATTTVSTYKIRITPKSHLGMPAPQGAFYSVTAYISDWTDTNDHAGSDSGGTTVTIDNLSPNNVSTPTAAAWDAEVSLNWGNPADVDLATIVVLRRAGAAVADTPTEGATYGVGNTIGNSSVGCAVSSPGASCTDSGLTNNVTYYYKIFTRDSNGNWSANGVAPALPATPQHYQPDAMIKLTSDGAFLSNDAYESAASSQSKSHKLSSGLTATYNLRFQNDGSTTDNFVITGTGSGSNFTVQYLDDTAVDRTAAVTPPGAGYTIPGVAVGAYKDWTLKVTPNGGATPVPGGSSYQVLATATSANRSSSVDQVRAVTTSSSANITLLKSADKSSCIPGEEITYTTTASNGAALSAASSVAVYDTVPPETGFKIAGASFDPGTSGQTGTVSFSDNYAASDPFTYPPSSGGCSAPAGYDYCVKRVRWTLPSMPAGASFTVSMTVRVK